MEPYFLVDFYNNMQNLVDFSKLMAYVVKMPAICFFLSLRLLSNINISSLRLQFLAFELLGSQPYHETIINQAFVHALTPTTCVRELGNLPRHVANFLDSRKLLGFGTLVDR